MSGQHLDKSDLTGRVAIVTGAARGIGRATATAFAQSRADLALIDVDAGALEQVAGELKATGVRAEPFVADLARVSEIRTVFARIWDSYGRFDALANVAAIYPVAPVLEVTEEHWDAIHSLDLRGVFFCCQEALRKMFEQGSGAIVNVSSGSAYRAVQPNASAYSAAKGGIVGMSRSLALEGARHGVRVNVVAPGYTESDGIKAVVSEEDRAAHGAMLVPGRLIQPEEVAEAIVFLCSDAASGMNGSSLHVTGGDYMP
ncbi:MAG: SDR family oxidoreductase [Deltaproteobacteria bacterium]|nr:SDR family oxidoreductase [Deltaproteobacteria bacterium]MBW2359696.1 SDR family oxidoreductase [Deltaproteobacteria bacterium]